MTRCERYRIIASLRVDHEPSRLELALLSAHELRCTTCTQFSADVAAMTDLVRATPLQAQDHQVIVARTTSPLARCRRAFHACGVAAAVLVLGIAASGSSFATALDGPRAAESFVSGGNTVDGEAQLLRLLSRPEGVPGVYQAT